MSSRSLSIGIYAPRRALPHSSSYNQTPVPSPAPVGAGFQLRQKVVHSQLSVALVAILRARANLHTVECQHSSTATFHEVPMPPTCRECGTTFSDKNLDGTVRTMCPVCKASLAGPSKAGEPVALSTSLHSLLGERAARKRGDWDEIRQEPFNYKPQQPVPLRQRILRWVVLSSSIFFAITGIGFSVRGCSVSSEKNASTAWPETSGMISFCDVREVRLKSRRWWQKVVLPAFLWANLGLKRLAEGERADAGYRIVPADLGT